MSGHIVDVAADKIFQVENMSRNDVLKRIEEIWENYVDLESGQMQLLSRTEKFQSYFENRLVVKQNLEGKPERRRRLCIMRMLGLVHDYVKEGVLTTTRHLFYSDVAKFIHQAYSDMILDDVCCIVGSSRPSLNTFAANRGVVAGCLSMKLQGGIQINCADYGYGFPIIPLLDGVGLETRDATFILFVEKYSVFFEFVHFKFFEKHPCIIITGYGMPDVATRTFLNRLAKVSNLPVLGLVDCDPSGIEILYTCCVGSANMAFNSRDTTTTDIIWVGLFPTQLTKYLRKEKHIAHHTLNIRDRLTLNKLINTDFVKKKPLWFDELQHMPSTGIKASLEALEDVAIGHLSQVHMVEQLERLGLPSESETNH